MTKENFPKGDKLDSPEVFFPPQAESSRLLVGCRHGQYMASRLARAVEDADAQLLNLDVTSLQADGFSIVVALRVSHRDPASVARSVERYGYTVIETSAHLGDDDNIRDRYDELMHYLSM